MNKPEHVGSVLARIMGRLAEGKDPITGKPTKDQKEGGK